jgi:ribonucleoside-diphosphate reductase alpha chain
MPSMRLLQFAGKAARATNVCAYNCSFIAPSKWQDFAEVMYISMCGTGAGWAVQSENIQQLPQIKKQTGKKLPIHVIADSKEGWCDAFALGLKTWADGNDIDFDFSLLRPAGARLATMGGKSSGPEPLRQLLTFSRTKILSRQGRRLENIDAHDILCKVGEIVVAGGVRRSAMISLSDLYDDKIRDAKKGQFWNTDPQRMLANNSAVYDEKPSSTEFLEEWIALMKSKSGERGIFNAGSLPKTLPERRISKFIKEHGQMPQLGTNPCGEIILKSKQFCNLSEVVARAEDTEASLLRKIKLATIIGTYQSTLTNFPYLSKEWKKNCESERLLGVSITGMWDSDTVRDPKVLQKLKKESVRVNKLYAKRFGVGESTCITCNKPSGNLSQTVDSSSGMHPRFAPYYIRRVRISATDALFKMLKDQGVPYSPEVGQSMESATTYVIDFPVKAP